MQWCVCPARHGAALFDLALCLYTTLVIESQQPGGGGGRLAFTAQPSINHQHNVIQSGF